MKTILFVLITILVIGSLACVVVPPTPTPTPEPTNTPTPAPTETAPIFVPTPKPIPPVFGQLWACSDKSNCFNYGVVPGPDAICLLFDRSGVSTYGSIPAWCAVDPAYTGTFTQVQAKWIPLPYGEWLSYQMFYKGGK